MIRNFLRTVLFRSFSESIKGEVRVVKNVPVIIVSITIMVSILVGVAYANFRYVIPDEDQGPPIYADFYGNEELVAFFFYRDPECVPPDFDLYFTFYHFPHAFACELTIEGFVVYKNPPPEDFAPKQAKFKGSDEVPVWFVSTDDFQDAISGGSVTIEDLEEMESLQVGSATSYQEVLHPMGHPEMPMKIIEASGTLEDGRSFRINSVWVGSWPTPVHSHMTILFK